MKLVILNVKFSVDFFFILNTFFSLNLENYNSIEKIFVGWEKLNLLTQNVSQEDRKS